MKLKQAQQKLEKEEAELDVIGCDEHIEMQKEAADLGITLVKNTLNQLPIFYMLITTDDI
jgi:beta-N-acetylhexosaminidase